MDSLPPKVRQRCTSLSLHGFPPRFQRQQSCSETRVSLVPQPPRIRRKHWEIPNKSCVNFESVLCQFVCDCVYNVPWGAFVADNHFDFVHDIAVFTKFLCFSDIGILLGFLAFFTDLSPHELAAKCSWKSSLICGGWPV